MKKIGKIAVSLNKMKWSEGVLLKETKSKNSNSARGKMKSKDFTIANQTYLKNNTT